MLWTSGQAMLYLKYARNSLYNQNNIKIRYYTGSYFLFESHFRILSPWNVLFDIADDFKKRFFNQN